MTSKKTEVATLEPSSADLPAYLQGQTFGVEDNFGTEDVYIPRIKLLQGTSDEVQNFDNAKIGMFWHGGADIPLGEELTFVICDRRKKILLSAPIEDGQGVLARADDAKTWDRTGSWQVKLKGVKQPVTWEITDTDVAKSGLMNWGTSNPGDDDSAPAATLFYDYLVLCLEHLDLGPAVISLARSQIRKAKKELNPKIKMHTDKGRPIQALKFRAKSVDDSADGQAFKNWSFQMVGFADEELYNMARPYSGALADQKVQDEAGDIRESEKAVDTGEGNF